jgi:hypothetical protein
MSNDIKRAQQALNKAHAQVEATAKTWREALRSKAPAGQIAKAKALNTRAIEDEMNAEEALKKAMERNGVIVNNVSHGQVGIQAAYVNGRRVRM